MVAGRKGEPMNRHRTSMERTSDKEIVITRTFRAPAHIVFDAWTKPELVRRWWAPKSRGVTLVQCDADVRPGGAYRYVLARGKAERFAFFGLDGALTSGMEAGMRETFDQLDELVASLRG